MVNGNLMTINEVAARLDVSPMTVHRLPLKSIRVGRLLRFDPKDVGLLIERSKEALSLQPASICDQI
jgi:DNA-binding IclR family transcriptional regulator